MPEPNGWHPERYRPLLRLQVRQLQLDPRLQRRFDESDLVQEALLRAHRGLSDFRGDTEAAFLKWLEHILANVLTDAIRREHADKRNVALERSLDAALEQSSARLGDYLVASGDSPAEHVEREEQLLRLAEALEQLPDDYRDVIIHRELRGAPLAEIAAQMGRTGKSIAGLLLRARRRLRELLDQQE